MTDAEVEALRDILRRSGAEAASRAEAERLCAEALAALEGSMLPAAVAAELRAIAEYTVRRTQ
jgi:geranylgeranyl pyrophosphate synthase